jgi:hypothetical protein
MTETKTIKDSETNPINGKISKYKNQCDSVFNRMQRNWLLKPLQIANRMDE